jgi:hypothetical protein
MLHLNWAVITLTIGLVFCVLLLWALNRGDSPYFFRDLLLDTATGRASLDKHILLFFAALSCWYVVTRTLNDNEVDTVLLGVLGIFVVQRGATQAINAFKKPEDPK